MRGTNPLLARARKKFFKKVLTNPSRGCIIVLQTKEVTPIRDLILKALAKYPNGLRQRMIASEIGCWTANPELRHTLDALTNEGILSKTYYSDPANMEYYFIWKIA